MRPLYCAHTVGAGAQRHPHLKGRSWHNLLLVRVEPQGIAGGHLGVPLASEKTEGPMQKLMCLGTELDTMQDLSQLSREKLATLKTLIWVIWGTRITTYR